jgi:hypothetical protein
LNRKRLKLKRRSCALCKPHKMGWAPRFKEKQGFLLKIHVAEIRNALD